MANWVSAGTPDFWEEAGYVVYLGEGQWSIGDLSYFSILPANPILASGASIWGVRYEWSAPPPGEVTLFSIDHAFNAFGFINTAVTSPMEAVLDSIDRIQGEYLSYIGFSGWFGQTYGYANLLIRNIELYTDWVPSSLVWTSFIGSAEITQ
jgi:hypothetical protein